MQRQTQAYDYGKVEDSVWIKDETKWCLGSELRYVPHQYHWLSTCIRWELWGRRFERFSKGTLKSKRPF